MDHIPLANRLFGLMFGLPMSALGTWGLLRGPLSFGLIFIGAVGAFGYFIVLGCLGSSDLHYSAEGARLRFRLFGRLPLFSKTLAGPGEVVGLRHIRRAAGFQSVDGEWLDEHFLVLATNRPHDYVVEDLGRLTAARGR